MTGLERNADVVHMATYAPLLAHVEGWQWRPDMVWFDNLQSVPTASYYVQKLYGNHRGDRVLPITMDGKAVTGADGQEGLYATAALAENGGKEYIVKVVNTSAEPREITVDFKGLKKSRLADEYKIITLSSPEGLEVDNIDGFTERVRPLEKAEVCGNPSAITTTIPPYTFAVIVRGITEK